jgi:MFS family permease
MLAQLKLSYAQFMLLVALGFAGKVIGLPLWGRLAHRYGARSLMWIGGISISPVASLWLALPWIESPIPYLIVVQVVGGIAWAAYELAFLLMFFETIPRNERISLLTLYNVGNAFAMALGAAFGALILSGLGEAKPTYLLLFGVSSVCRALALGLLARVPRMRIDVVVPALRILSLRSSDEASLDRPVLPTIPPCPPQSLDAATAPRPTAQQRPAEEINPVGRI